MLGCMVGTSLAMAPALLLSNLSDIVDLDGPLFLKQDRKNHIEYKDFLAFPISKDCGDIKSKMNNFVHTS